jgi:hypothetical protein
VLDADTRDPAGIAYCAWVLFYAGGADEEAASLLHWTIAANPNCYQAWIFAAWHAIATGDPELGLSRIAMAERLDPAPANATPALLGRAAAHFFAGRFAEAVAAARSAVARTPRMPSARAYLVTALAQMDEIEAAAQEAAVLLRLQPCRTLRFTASIRICRDDAMQALFMDGLRRAGIPE